MVRGLNSKGISLVEVIISVIIVSIFLAALLPFIFETIVLNNKSEKKLHAFEEAHKKIEELRNDDYSNITSGPFDVTSITGAAGTVTVDNDIDGDDIDEVDIIKVTVDVDYPDAGETRNVSLTTLISNGGVTN